MEILIKTSILLNLFNYILTIETIIFTYKILIEFKVKKKHHSLLL